MPKRKIITSLKNTLKKLVRKPGREDRESEEKMSGEIWRMGRLNSELILMMK